jgi:transcriptional regulator GlxA family with amidase domain
MYQTNPISWNEADVAHVSAAARTAGDDEPEAGADTLVSMLRLRSAVTELLRALNEALRDERSNAVECLRRAEAMLEAERQAAAAPPAARQGLAPWQLRRVLAYVEANLDKTVRNKDLAAVARLSAFHFNVAFRNSVGDSPHEYIIRRRIERAQGLMLSTDAPLSEIALECGLSDQAHFTRLFRRMVGESPAAWRRARANPPRKKETSTLISRTAVSEGP